MEEVDEILEKHSYFIRDKKEHYKLTYITLRFLCSILKRMLYEKNITGFKFTPENEMLCGFEIEFPCLENGDIHPIEKVFIALQAKPDDTFMKGNFDHVTSNWLIKPFRNNSSKYFSIYHIEEYEYDVIKDFYNFDINGLVEEILNLFYTPYLSLDEYTSYKDKKNEDEKNEEI